MCITLNLPDGKYATVIAELDAALGWRAPIEDGYGEFTEGDRDYNCLCPIDMKELTRLTGWTIEAGDFDPMELVASIPTDGAPEAPPKVRTPQTPENNNG